MKIALAQLNYTIGDIDSNVSQIIGAIRKAEAEGADLVLFAEYAISGTPAYDLLRKTTFLTLCEEALEQIAEACTRVTAIVGSPVLTERGAVSAAAVLRNGCVDEIVEKDMGMGLGTWMDFRVEAFEAGTDLEGEILNSLINEVVCDIMKG